MAKETDGAYVALKGYCYQFDKTILEILKNPSKDIQIEQIQDLGYDDYIIQVKHHDTEYVESQKKARKKKPILQLLDEFSLSSSKKYILYIYFKGESPKEQTLTIAELDDILSSDAIRYSTSLKSGFIKNFKLVFSEDYIKLHTEVISLIKNSFVVSSAEAEIYYSIISSHLLDTILRYPVTLKDKRVSSKKTIDSLLSNNKKTIFNSCYFENLNKDVYLKAIRKKYFVTPLNIEPFDRFFIIEASDLIRLEELKELVLIIKAKWSKNSGRTTNSFAPYICFNGLSEKKLIQLKSSLVKDGYVIRDGYDFLGSPFSFKSITTVPTKTNQILFRIVSEAKSIIPLLHFIENTKEVYQFHQNSRIDIDLDIKHICIKVQDISDIKNII